MDSRGWTMGGVILVGVLADQQFNRYREKQRTARARQRGVTARVMDL